MATTTCLSTSAILSSLVAVLILVLVVDDVSAGLFRKGKSKGEPTPLYGIVLHGHPYPKRLPSVPTPLSSYLPFYPNGGPSLSRPPQYYPPPPPPPTTYQPLPVYQPVTVAPNYKPSLPAYQPPVTKPYQPAPHQPTPYQPAPYQPAPHQPTPYQPAPYQPAPHQPTPYQPAPYKPAPYQPRPQLPVPTTFDDKPWQPITTSVTSAQYVLNPDFQVNEIDGYPWTEELQEGPEANLPEVLFYPNKSLAQQHAEATNIEFNPHPDRKPFDDSNSI